jgi:hypothetical protein
MKRERVTDPDHAQPAAELPDVTYLLNTDGGIVAAANQPEGEAAMGVIVTDPQGDTIAKASARLGWCKDHHIAEFNALLLGLSLATQWGSQSSRFIPTPSWSTGR